MFEGSCCNREIDALVTNLSRESSPSAGDIHRQGQDMLAVRS
jgi:hypothetical protein